MEFDAFEARNIARRLASAASELDQISSVQMKRLKADSTSCLTGEGGNAMVAGFNELNQDLRALSNGLKGIQSQLNSFIKRMELIDKALGR